MPSLFAEKMQILLQIRITSAYIKEEINEITNFSKDQ